MARLLFSFVLLVLAGAAAADLPDRRALIYRDTDFSGGDIQSIFDTTQDACETACIANRSCRAYTYNTRSSACFIKERQPEPSAFAGAVSARIVETDPAVLAVAAERRAALGFLRNADLLESGRLAARLGRLYPTDGNSAADLLAGASFWQADGNLMAALPFVGGALAIVDSADLWRDYARIARLATTDDEAALAALRAQALPAAIAAYLRSLTVPEQVAGLMELAQALEQAGQGPAMIPALRRAYQLDPRPEISAALDEAIGRHGFRVSDTQVDSESTNPRICVIFSDALIKSGTDYAPFVQLPDPGYVVSASDGQLCIEGMAHGTRVGFTLREGLPAASGEKLARSVDLVAYVRDRSPAVRFLSRAYVLPRLGEIAVPVETVNLSELDLTLRRMSDRNILRGLQEGLLSGGLGAWQIETLDQSLASTVWTGRAEVGAALNREVLTRLPLADALAGQPAGLYLLTAARPGIDARDGAPAAQWFVLSDIGIATWLGNDGLTVMTRQLGDAAPLPAASVQLISESNAVLATAFSDQQGIARFAAGLTRGTGPDAPALVTVSRGDDLAFLSLRDAAFDLSDRGVAGREPSPPIDVFLTPDRGAYRAGETIHLTALMRDAQARAVQGVPLTARLLRPDGVEYLRSTATRDQAGGHVFALDVADNAPRGTWTAEVSLSPHEQALARTTILVEDFLPERLDFDLALPDRLLLGDAPQMTLSARYLYGAAAAGLAIEGEAALTPLASLSGHEGYVFGNSSDPFTRVSRALDSAVTGEDGAVRVAVALPDVAAVQPLQLTVTARVSEGSGRPVARQATATVLPDVPFIGIRPRFDGVVGEGEDARFDLIALTPDLTGAGIEAIWTINRINTRYQWYTLDGNWNWEPVTTRERIASGSATLGDSPVTVGAVVDWGQYEIVVERSGPEYAVAATGFDAGWYAPASATDTPDLLQASLDAPRYAIGDTAQFRIVPRYAGTAVITVMSDHVIALQTLQVEPGENVVELPVTDEWGAGVYVSAHVIRPMAPAEGRNPARALGLGYAAIDPGARALDVSITAPDQARPRGPLTVGLRVDGIAGEETAYLTLAAVDLGIVNITGFSPPDPQDHYFGQRRLGVELRDLYGRLIDGLTGTMGIVRSGGDAMAQMTMQSPPPTQDLVVFFHGPVPVGPDGTAQVDLDLPAFNGTLRLMAVVWSQSGVGQASRDVQVRDPVVVTASVPRFLAPDDQSRMLLEIAATEEAGAGEVGLKVTAEGLALAQVLPPRITLAEGETQIFAVPFAAVDPGQHRLTVAVTLPDGEVLTQSLRVPVVVNDPQIGRSSRFALAPGEEFTFDSAVFAGLATGTGHATLSAGPLARLDAPGLLSALDRYPYGCTEQVTSQALPLLYLSGVSAAMGLGRDQTVDRRIAEAIAVIGANQAANGGFGLWGAGSGDMWLDAYVTDFLSRARTTGHAVPELTLRNAIDNLRNQVNYYPDFERGGADLAYALMVLAREGVAVVGDLRYYADQKADALDSPLALAQLGAALALNGDPARADALFARAGAQALQAAEAEQTLWRADYGTRRRDRAAVLALASEAGSMAVDREALVAQIAQDAVAASASTQESAWTLLAAHALLAGDAAGGITVDGAAPEGPLVQVLESQVEQAPRLIANNGDAAVDITVTSFGVPTVPEPAGGNGWQIERAHYTPAGEPVDVAQVSAGDRLVVVLTVRPFGYQEARLMVNDPLPAGFEIDNPNLLQGGDIAALDWLDPVRAETAQFRSDRFLAAVDRRSDQVFRLAYMVRAVTPGAYHHPAALVEDMYRPQMRAWTDTGRIVVAPQ